MKCIYCDENFEVENSNERIIFLRHLFNKHRRQWNSDKLTADSIVLKLFYDNKIPTCLCGCGNEMKYRPGTGFYTSYSKGHYVNVKGNNPSTKDKEGARKRMLEAQSKWKELLETGERKIWCDGLTKEEHDGLKVQEYKIGKKLEEYYNTNKAKGIKEKISKKQKETIRKSKEDGTYDEKYRNKFKEYWSKEENRERQRNNRTNYLSTYKYVFSNFEKEFKDFLEEININFNFQFNLKGKLYDFLIKNTIIELHGDYWHCNPKFYPNGPLYETQKLNIYNDKIKYDLALENGYDFLIIWESEWKNNKEEIKKKVANLFKINHL